MSKVWIIVLMLSSAAASSGITVVIKNSQADKEFEAKLQAYMKKKESDYFRSSFKDLNVRDGQKF